MITLTKSGTYAVRIANDRIAFTSHNENIEVSRNISFSLKKLMTALNRYTYVFMPKTTDHPVNFNEPDVFDLPVAANVKMQVNLNNEESLNRYFAMFCDVNISRVNNKSIRTLLELCLNDSIFRLLRTNKGTPFAKASCFSKGRVRALTVTVDEDNIRTFREIARTLQDEADTRGTK